MHSPAAAVAPAALNTASLPRLVIADDHCMVAEGIERLLVDDFELLEVASDGEALLAAVRRQNPDVVISDIRMPGMSGLDVLKQLRSEGSRVPFIFLTMHAEPALAAAAMRAGANGYVVKYAAGKDLVAAVRQVLSGGVYVTPSRGARYLSSELQEIQTLTVKRREVLRLVGRRTVFLIKAPSIVGHDHTQRIRTVVYLDLDVRSVRVPEGVAHRFSGSMVDLVQDRLRNAAWASACRLPPARTRLDIEAECHRRHQRRQPGVEIATNGIW